MVWGAELRSRWGSHRTVELLVLKGGRSLCLWSKGRPEAGQEPELFSPSSPPTHTPGRLRIPDLSDRTPLWLAGCAEPLGLKDNTIPNKQITASSFYRTWGLSAFSWYPFYARLDNQGKFNAWTAQSNSASEWLQVGQASSWETGWG